MDLAQPYLALSVIPETASRSLLNKEQQTESPWQIQYTA